ncbi:MAG TPA: SH3 domain-containing C40 family peptidase [bacterium]|nr:SH3 domain-containing C40 family peptidase [bacterium]
MFTSKKFLVFIMGIMIFFCISCNANQRVETTMKENIKKIKNEFAPDTRVEIFDIEVNSKGGGIYLEGATSSKKAYTAIQELIASAQPKNISNQVRLLPDENLEHTNAIINISVGNIRSEDSHPSTLITQAMLGTPVKIMENDGWWYRIQTPDNYIGWIDASGIEKVSQEKLNKWKNADKVIFTNRYGSVYKSKNTNSGTISDIVMGNILQLVETYDNWYKVIFPDGRTGYIKKEKAQTIPEWQKNIEISGQSIANLAKEFMGIPYLWGGTSIKGADCSGFVKTVFFMHGIILQRDASQQTQYGELVPVDKTYDKLQPGDLIFFGRNRVTHVGIYIGDYEFIHASGLVKVNSLDKDAPNYSPSRESSIIRARRIVNSLDEDGISIYSENKFYQ